ncbi:MAG: hypothetical protein QXQ14_02595 [Candidatus Aenigmatarchaeota archaeon]
MKKLSLPPLIKYLEAYSVFADNRIKEISKNEYRIISSDKRKEYLVKIKFELGKILVFSNDNGTILKNYIGYPIIAVLIYKNVLKLPKNIEVLKNIEWKKLNEKFKNYDKVINYLKEKIGNTIDEIIEFSKENEKILKSLNIVFEEANKFE